MLKHHNPEKHNLNDSKQNCITMELYCRFGKELNDKHLITSHYLLLTKQSTNIQL